jgi:pimeloyl-ACP methyl ester carboxylesterase
MELNYKMYGQGIPVVILHGVFGMLDNWHHFAKQLSEDFWVTTLDQRNHGRSPHSDDFDYDLMVEDLKSFLWNHQIKKTHFIGHSMGGKVAMFFSLRYPELVDKTVVVDIGVKSYPPRHDKIFESLCGVDVTAMKSREDIQTELSKAIAQKHIVNFLLKNVARERGSEYFRWKMNLKAIRNNYEKLLTQVYCDFQSDKEVLFIKGDNSDYILHDDMIEIMDFPKAKIETIKDAGHWVHAEQEYTMLQIVRDFLQ